MTSVDCGEGSSAQAAHAIEDGEGGDGAAGEQACGHAESEREVLLVEAVDDADGLQDAEAAEGDERDAFIAFLAPDGHDLRHEEQRVAAQAQPKDDGDNLLHAARPPLPNLAALRAFALAASSSRLRGGALVSSEVSRWAETAAISSTARLKCGFVGLGRLVEAADLAHELERGGANLLVGYGRIEVEEHFDVAAHREGPPFLFYA